MTNPQRKVNNGNGNGRGHPDDRQLAYYLKALVADLRTVEVQRRDCLREFSKRRTDLYAVGREFGISPHLLRAANRMSRNGP
jgi:hypothetical protein